MNEKSITLPIQGANGAFANVLAGHRRGSLLSQCDDALKEVTDAVMNSGMDGKLTLTLKFKSEGKADATDSPMFEIDGDVTIKKPRKKIGKSKWYADEEGNLMRNDPKQVEIKFGEIEGGKPAAAASTTPQSSVASGS